MLQILYSTLRTKSDTIFANDHHYCSVFRDKLYVLDKDLNKSSEYFWNSSRDCTQPVSQRAKVTFFLLILSFSMLHPEK